MTLVFPGEGFSVYNVCAHTSVDEWLSTRKIIFALQEQQSGETGMERTYLHCVHICIVCLLCVSLRMCSWHASCVNKALGVCMSM